jgi:alpha-tubulin suppressor-like RCC1 family protein
MQCLGDNMYGSFGLGEMWGPSTQELQPRVPMVNKAIKIVAGNMHFCALCNDGTVLCWGKNNKGKIMTICCLALANGLSPY